MPRSLTLVPVTSCFLFFIQSHCCVTTQHLSDWWLTGIVPAARRKTWGSCCNLWWILWCFQDSSFITAIMLHLLAYQRDIHRVIFKLKKINTEICHLHSLRCMQCLLFTASRSVASKHQEKKLIYGPEVWFKTNFSGSRLRVKKHVSYKTLI